MEDLVDDESKDNDDSPVENVTQSDVKLRTKKIPRRKRKFCNRNKKKRPAATAFLDEGQDDDSTVTEVAAETHPGSH